METVVTPDVAGRARVDARRGFGRLAAFAAAYTYALIVVGGVVRITGSGLGCGDAWPKCHGSWIPPMSAATVIEYTHRLLAAGVAFVVGAVLVRALQLRARPGFGGRGGLVRPAVLAAVLLVVQVLLGGITVRLNLSGPVTVLHLGTAMALLATLLVAAVRAGALGAATAAGADGSGSDGRAAAGRVARMAVGAAVLAYLVVLLGALVANTGAPVSGAPSAAALAVLGVPLITTPSHPEYPAGHPSLNGAAATVLLSHFRRRQTFTLTTIGQPSRTYTSITSNQTAQDYTGTSQSLTISGRVKWASAAQLAAVSRQKTSKSPMRSTGWCFKMRAKRSLLVSPSIVSLSSFRAMICKDHESAAGRPHFDTLR